LDGIETWLSYTRGISGSLYSCVAMSDLTGQTSLIAYARRPRRFP
jgi:hypothetical protein